MTIDNGNHLLLSGNHAALALSAHDRRRARLVGPPQARISVRRPREAASSGRCASMTAACRGGSSMPARRVPDTHALDYLPLARLLWAAARQAGRRGHPLQRHRLRAAGAAAAARRAQHRSGRGLGAARGAVIRETLAGGRACRPLIARDGLGATLIEPALAYLRRAQRRRAFRPSAARAASCRRARVEALDFGGDTIALGADDAVILAVPPYAAARTRARPADADRVPRHRQRAFPHRAARRSAADPRRAQRHDRMDVRVSGPALGHDQRRRPAARHAARSAGAEDLERGRRRHRAAAELPPWQIVRERRATFAATPEQDARRPGATTAWRNLVLAGDWTDTGLPATIESAIRSGHRAAALIAGGRPAQHARPMTA